MGIEANKQLVVKFMELFSEAKLNEAFELLADDVVWSLWGSGPAAGSYDKSAMRAMLDQSFGFFVGPLQWTPTSFTAEGDRVAVEAVSYGKTRGGFEYRNKYHPLFRVRDGKLVEIKEMFEETPVQALFAALQAEAAQA
jgi:uncharacterized protein